MLPETTATWNHRIIDRLFQFRAKSSLFRPPYNDIVVHFDISRSTFQWLNQRHLDRRHHAQVIDNLGHMGTSAQLYDFVFAAEWSKDEDRRIVNATHRSGNACFGIIFLFDITKNQRSLPVLDPAAIAYLNATLWDVVSTGRPLDLPVASDAIITFTKLAEVSEGLGSLNLNFDADGVYRRYPLVFRYKNAIYPSIVLRIVCDYLEVAPGAIVLDPGRYLALKSARFPRVEEPRDIQIPIDPAGNMVIDFIGPWEQMRHYNFADILHASNNNAEMALWKDELAGKIVVVSEVLSGSSDAGPVPSAIC